MDKHNENNNAALFDDLALFRQTIEARRSQQQKVQPSKTHSQFLYQKNNIKLNDVFTFTRE